MDVICLSLSLLLQNTNTQVGNSATAFPTYVILVQFSVPTSRIPKNNIINCVQAPGSRSDVETPRCMARHKKSVSSSGEARLVAGHLVSLNIVIKERDLVKECGVFHFCQ